MDKVTRSPASVRRGRSTARPSRPLSAPILFLGAVELLAVACGDGSGPITPTTPPPPSPSLSISPDSAALSFIGETARFTARDQTGADVSGTVTWSSDRPEVFTVSAGLVTAVGSGSGTVTATLEGVSASARVTVDQVATDIQIVAGDNQQGLVDSSLPDPVVVRVLDEGGTAVAGAAVSWAPGNGGSVSDTTAVATDDQGLASNHWTLGPAIGMQTLAASIPGASVEFRATALSLADLPDLIVDNRILVSDNEPWTVDSISVRATVLNAGTARTSEGFPVAVRVGGVEAARLEAGSLGPGESATLTFSNVGLPSAGVQEIQVVADPDGKVAEVIESNNGATLTLIVRSAAVLTLGGSAMPISAGRGGELLFVVDAPPGRSGSALHATVRVRSGDPDLYVTGHPRASRLRNYACQSAGPGLAEECIVNLDVFGGRHYIVVHAAETFAVGTLAVSIGEPARFNLDVVYESIPTIAEAEIIEEAVARWESVIVGDMPAFRFYDDVTLDNCGAEPVTLERGLNVEDVQLRVDLLDTDEYIYTQTICYYRRSTGLPIVSAIGIDFDRIARFTSSREDVVNVVASAIGQALGKNEWLYGEIHDLIRNRSAEWRGGMPGADSHFVGPKAIAAFDAAGGTAYSGGKVPLQNNGEYGTDARWRGSVFGNELMSSTYAWGEPHPLSAITVQSFADLGYVVDVEAADAYTLPKAAGMSLQRDLGVVVDWSRHSRVQFAEPRGADDAQSGSRR